MSFSKEVYFEHQQFEPGSLTRFFSNLIGDESANPEDKVINLFYERLPDGTIHTKSNINPLELASICDLYNSRMINTYFFTQDGGYLHVTLQGHETVISASVRAETPEKLNVIFGKIRDELSLENAPSPLEKIEDLNLDSPEKDAFEEISRRLREIEKELLSRKEPLRCFLSYRFVSENEVIASKIQQFLRLLGVEVITGESYEPRKVSEKVLSRLREHLDFIVIIIASGGESLWTRDEISTAFSRGISVIPVVERGASFEQGLFGDLEYIHYEKDHIGDAFLKLLEAIQFIRREKGQQVDEDEEI